MRDGQQVGATILLGKNNCPLQKNCVELQQVGARASAFLF